MRNYFTKFKYQSITYLDFKEFFIEKMNELLPSEAEKILSKIDWIEWIEAPGFPPVDIDFSNKYDEEVKKMVSLFYENKLPSDFVDIFKSWDESLKESFVTYLDSENKELDDEQYNYITNVLNLRKDYNSIIAVYYYTIVLANAKIFEEKIKQDLIEFLGITGRINYLKILYPAFYKRDKEAALQTFEKYRNFYHPMVVKYIELEFKKLN